MPTPAAELNTSTVEEQMLEIVRGLLSEISSRQAAEKVTLHSSFDRDLGLGSLERVELLLRVESRFHRRLPDDVAQTADTPAAWVRALLEPAQEARQTERRHIDQPGEAPAPPVSAKNFIEVLRGHAEHEPERTQIHLLEDSTRQVISYAQLFERASEVAAGLHASGLKRNEAVAIMLPTCDDFFYAFFGVMLAGGIAVPIYPPARPDKIEEYVRRQTLILENAEVRFLISFDQVRAVSKVMRLRLPSLVDVTTAAALRRLGAGSPAPGVNCADLFFIQYTSGSTGNPKGVVLTHANVLANVQGIGWAVQARPDDVVVSWLPLYHDMGLIGSWLFSVFYAFPITVMSPLAFLSRPERWLWALSDSGGTLCPAPNFSYELCARKITDEALQGVDLSAWRVAINAGEPVLPDTLERFAKRFAAVGFHAESYVPCYGLAESSVALTFPPINRPPLIDTIRRGVFRGEGRAVPAESGDPNVLRFVANGRPLPGHEVRIVDDEGNDLPERMQGRLLFRGPSKTEGYFRNPEATQAVTTPDGWMDSGDLGYAAAGEIYITGRMKDCIIKAGHNIIPQEVEMAAAEVEGVRRGCVAAFGTVDRETGTERLVVVAETRTRNSGELERIREEIVRRVDAQAGLPPDRVELVAPQTVPKTSSGKIRRNETRALYESGTLRGGQRAPWLQMARLVSENLDSWAQLGARAAGRTLRRWYTGFVIAKGGIGGGLVARLCPTQRIAGRWVRIVARMMLWFHGERIEKRNTKALASAGPALFAANRRGDMDTVAMLAAIPRPVLLADAQMIEHLPMPLQFLLSPLVVPAVANGRSSVSLGSRVGQALADGFSVLAFADNPSSTPAGCSRFRIELFEAAQEMSVVVCPTLLCDTGRILQPGGRSREKSVAPVVVFGDPLQPKSIADPVRCRQALREALGQMQKQEASGGTD
jgi:acyl carrier protein